MDQCPMLIGIMQRSPRENDPFLESKYEYKELLKGNSLIHTRRELNLETLFDQLVTFKEEFDENEQYLVSICYILLYISIKNSILVI